MLSPLSIEAMAFLTPATCHSLTSRYSLSASAARNDRLRPVLFASFSSRFLTSVSTRTVNVVDDIADRSGVDCVHTITKISPLQPRRRTPSEFVLRQQDELTSPLRLA